MEIRRTSIIGYRMFRMRNGYPLGNQTAKYGKRQLEKISEARNRRGKKGIGGENCFALS